MHCQLSTVKAIEFASIYASASFLEASPLLSSYYPLTTLYLESRFFCLFSA